MSSSKRRRRQKQTAIEEHPSSVSVEYISVHREGNGHITKKRVIKKSAKPSLIINSLNSVDVQSDFNFLLTAEGEPAEPNASRVSRAVSVSVVPPCHVIVYSHPADQACGLDSTPSGDS